MIISIYETCMYYPVRCVADHKLVLSSLSSTDAHLL